MKEFDKIIGYEHIKTELAQIADMFKNRKYYENLGADYSQGIILYGVPGVGKSLMATSLIKESGLRFYTCRKNLHDGEFVRKIKNIFDEAKLHAPAIVFLDDLDKFANGDEFHPDAEEYVTVQSCIDEVKGKNVFVVATANKLACLPPSLLRAGRFGKQIYVDTPDFKESKLIISHYLEDKKVDKDIDVECIAKLIYGSSCAELEIIIKEAAVYAGFERAECICMRHFIKAALRIIYRVSLSDISEKGMTKKDKEKVAYHEAGHALIQELLYPGTVVLLSLYGSREDKLGGFTKICYTDYESIFNSGECDKSETEILTSMGGAAATEQKFGIFDMGASADFRDAFKLIHRINEVNCLNGFNLYSKNYETSSATAYNQENIAAVEMGRYFRKAKRLIAQNMDILDTLADKLMNKKLLVSNEIYNIIHTNRF